MARESPVSPSAPQIAWSEADLRANPHEAPDKPQRVRKMFASIARQYDLNNRVHSLGRDQAWRRKAVSLCEVRPSDDVLDVACGTGDLTIAFAQKRPRSVTGIDFTAEMLEIARTKTAKIPNPNRRSAAAESRIEYRHGDAMNLAFPDASFDIVSIAFGIRNVADPARALREFRRVLRPGGRLMVLEFSQPRRRVLRWLNDLYCGRIMPLTATLIARDRSGAYRYLPKSVATFPTSEEFTRLLESCGFTSVSAHPMTFGICTAYLAHVR